MELLDKPEGRETMMRAYRNKSFAHMHLGPRSNDLGFKLISASIVITRKFLQTAGNIEAEWVAN